METLDQLVKEFAENVAKQTDSIWKGDANIGNRHAKRYIHAFQLLRARGDKGREALTVLFDHERPDVRVAAAAFLLRYRTAEATRVLEEIASGKGLASFEAGEALKRWAEGSWNLDPVDPGPSGK